MGIWDNPKKTPNVPLAMAESIAFGRPALFSLMGTPFTVTKQPDKIASRATVATRGHWFGVPRQLRKQVPMIQCSER